MGCGTSTSNGTDGTVGSVNVGQEKSDVIETDITFVGQEFHIPQNNHTSQTKPVSKESTQKPVPVSISVKSKQNSRISSSVSEPLSVESLDEDQENPKPSRRRKVNIIPDPTIFKDTDNHVSKVITLHKINLHKITNEML